MIRRLNILMVWMVTGWNAFGQTLPIAWAVNCGGVHDDFGWAIAVDPEGNAYATGHFSEWAAFGSQTLQSRGNYDMFLVKLNARGDLLWAIQAGGTGFDDGRSVAVDNSGNVYVTGSFETIADFGEEQLISAGKTDLFLACYNSNGNLQWATRAGGLEDDVGMGIGVDQKGNICVTGAFSGRIAGLQSAGLSDIFLAKYDAYGSVLWASCAGGPEVDEGQRVAIDQLGNVYVTGEYGTNAVFQTVTPPSRGFSDVFLAKYSADGSFLWLRTAGGDDVDYGYDVVTDSSLNVCIAGSFTGRATFENVAVSATGLSDIFAAKFSSDGTLKWVRAFGGSGPDQGYAISEDGADNVYVGGYYINSATFGRNSYNSPSHADCLVVKLSASGDFIWSTAAQGAAYSNTHGLAVTREGAVYSAGYFRGPNQFGTIHLSNHGDRDFFVTKIKAQPRLEIARVNGGMVLRWPTAPIGFHLEQSSSLGSSAQWIKASQTPSADGEIEVATNQANLFSQFFRLRN